MSNEKFIEKAKAYVADYAAKHCDKTDKIPDFDAYKKFENRCVPVE